MLKTSYWVILGGIAAMVIASVLLYLESLEVLAYAGLVIGFFAVGIGILMGFYQMVQEDQRD